MFEHCGKPLKSHQRQPQIKCPTVWSPKQIKRWPLSIGPQKRSSKTNWNSHWRWKSVPLLPCLSSDCPPFPLSVGWRQLIYLERETLIMRYEPQTTLSNEHQHQQQQKQQMRWQLCRIFNFFCRFYSRCCCFCRCCCCCCFEPWSSGQQLRLSTRYSLRAAGTAARQVQPTASWTVPDEMTALEGIQQAGWQLSQVINLFTSGESQQVYGGRCDHVLKGSLEE